MSFVVLLGLNLIVWTVFYLFFRAQLRKSMGSAELLKEIRIEVDQLVKELNLTAERNIGVLEERLGRLDILLKKADQRLTLLAKEEDKRANPLVYTRPKPVVPVPTKTEVETEPMLPGVASSFQKSASTEKLALKPSPVPPKAEPPEQNLRQRVLNLRAQGLSAEEIAQQTQAALAEVELILSLYPLRA
jgi:DNA-binding NarL/FixJ family response regulator